MKEPKLQILLIYPPSRTQSHQSCPMGMLMLGAVLEKAGHQVHLLDANASRGRKTTEDIVEIAGELRPDIIGMTLLTPLIRESYRLTQKLRGNGAKLIAGGPHATIMPEEVIDNGFDAVVLGEGEAVIVDAITALCGDMGKDKVRGWVYKDCSGRAVRTKPQPLIDELDALVLPARHLVDADEYGTSANKVLHSQIFSSRGCPAKCAYCAGGLFGKKFRFRSAESILNEIQHVHDTYGTTHFKFVDDAMALDKSRVRDICDGFRQRGLRVTWSMMTRIDTVDEELLKMLADSGCVQIDYGVESGYPDTLRRIHKPHTIQMAKDVIVTSAKLGIKSYAFFILGFPWEDVEATEATLELMMELSPYVERFHPAIASILVPFPGTEIYELYKTRYGFENWWLGTERNYDTPNHKTASYFELKVFWAGNVLDADFFEYSEEIKRRIHDVFKFIYMHNFQNLGVVSRLIHQVLIELSYKISGVSPFLERMIFSPVRFMESMIKSAKDMTHRLKASFAEIVIR